MIEKSVIVVVIVALMALAAVSHPVETNQDWKPIHYKLYATQNGPSLSMQEIHRLLMDLSGIYATETDASTNGRRSKILTLLNVGEVSESKCDKSHFDLIQHLLIFNAMFVKNIIPYLNYHKSRQVEICKKVINVQIHKVIETIPKPIAEDLAMMRRYIDEAEEERNKKAPKKHVDLSVYYIDGLLKYLIHKDQERVEVAAKFHSLEKGMALWELYDKQILRVCDRISTPLEKFDYIYKDGLTHLMNEEIKQWLKYKHNCEIFSRNTDLFVNGIKARVIDPNSGALAKFRNCFSSKKAD